MKISTFIKDLERPGTTLAAAAAGLHRKNGNRVLSLRSSGTPDGKPAEHVIEAAIRAPQENLSPPTNGFLNLREAIADKIFRESGHCVDPESEILVTTGAKEAIFILMAVLLAPGDEVILHAPNYVFDGAIKIHGGIPVYLRTQATDGFYLHMDEAAKKLSPRTRLMVLCNPVNPTGHLPSRAEVEDIANFSDRHDLTILSDESFEKYVYDDQRLCRLSSFPQFKPRVVTIQSFSKGHSMTAYRLGFMVAPPEIISACRCVLEWINVRLNPISQMAALAALTGPQEWLAEMLAAWQGYRFHFDKVLREIPQISYVSPQATGFAFLDIAAFGRPSLEVSTILLKKYGIPSVPGIVFEREGYIRVPIGGSKKVQHELGEALTVALKDGL